ncbi:hypothetical protein RISK_003767 [Rhodopirellula islandica]|uniref:Uncharacterized protein n=1 Tax=Rhodopirellula islandica TaxID=595434 RepID=A0A0J1BCE5_RHOIS|nr:hypothetical protein [Rhodopirellula islandica]KLU04181.1 hypothetical protein RISK_003767 [Rhodopirellula islandica]
MNMTWCDGADIQVSMVVHSVGGGTMRLRAGTRCCIIDPIAELVDGSSGGVLHLTGGPSNRISNLVCRVIQDTLGTCHGSGCDEAQERC